MKLGAAQTKAPAAWRLIELEVAERGASFTYRLDRAQLRVVRRREGRHLLRTNLTETDPAKLWQFYRQSVQVEAAFKTLKGDLAIRPIFHQQEQRIEAHIFVAFLAYCLHVTLGQQLRALAPSLTPRSVFEKFAAMQMIDVYVPTTDGRELSLTLHAARTRTEIAARETQTHLARPSTTENHRRSGRHSNARVVQTYCGTRMNNQSLGIIVSSESAKFG
jgi:hypothetical protein